MSDPMGAGASVREALAAWSAGERDPEFTDVLAQVGAAERPPEK